MNAQMDFYKNIFIKDNPFIFQNSTYHIYYQDIITSVAPFTIFAKQTITMCSTVVFQQVRLSPGRLDDHYSSLCQI